MDIVALLKEFGFPIAVAVWALWQLKTLMAKNAEFQTILKEYLETMNDIKGVVDKNSDIQNEMLTTLKILHAVLLNNRNGGAE